jgi:hypothetical protein
MKHVKVKELMTPLDRYTTVAHSASLKEAFEALQGALRGQEQHPTTRPRDFAVLVLDNNKQVTGRLVVWDILAGLETGALNRVDALSMIEDFSAWSQPSNLAARARQIRVADLVRSLHKEEYIDEDETLDKAVHQLVSHRFLSLIVTRNGRPTGVLRVVDVFDHISSIIQTT